MHTALQIPEILDLICCEVDTGDDPFSTQMPESKGTLARLARVCRVFQRPALDVLWREQEDLTNLLACMPADLWSITPASSARRPIEPADWDRVHLYSSRVRQFSFSNFPTAGMPDFWAPIFNMLAASYPENIIFPKLEALSWNPVCSSSFPYVRLFLCPSITSLSLAVISTITDVSILPIVPLRCPLLKSVVLSTGKNLHRGCRNRDMAICRMAHLQSLVVDDLDPTSLQHLAHLPSFSSLTIQNGPRFTPSRARSDLRRFLHLRDVRFSFTKHGITSAFLAMNKWSLVAFHSAMYSTPTARETAELYSILAEHCSHTSLTRLDLRTSKYAVLHFDAVEPYIVQSDALRILFPFRNLDTAFLSPPKGFDIDDATVEDLARAWPHLKTLRLQGGDEYVRPISRVTFRGIRALGQYCPRLNYLNIPFDASLVPHEVDIKPHESLFLLHVAGSFISDPEAVASYLYILFPRLGYIATSRSGKDVDRDLGASATLHERWMDVNARRLMS
ncbi:hypothetical protein DFH06DRAFT_1093842 [Mycena polygramma]|nr:hypothetical protein DFH06DRAFT_1093842 [Mycena polygramma]